MEANTAGSRGFVKWAAIFGVWTLFALFFASQFALQNQISPSPLSFWKILSWQLVSGYVWFAISPLILYLAGRFPFEEGRWRTSVAAHAFFCIAVSLVQLAVDAFVLTRMGYPPGREFAGFLEAYKFFVFINLHLSILIYLCVVGIKSAFTYYQKYRERQLQASQLEARLAQSRLQVLKMQLHPHFLFNTLNAISELLHRDPDAAEHMITDLSDLLRMSLENLEVQEIPLKQELEFLHKYIEIEQMRFQDRLKVEMAIAPEALDASVPNMILQPLVENAIKHGISPKAGGGRIDIEAARSNGHLVLSVTDDGVGVQDVDLSAIRDGVGLSNTRRRLKHLYGEEHRFELSVPSADGLRVDLAIPYKEAEKSI